MMFPQLQIFKNKLNQRRQSTSNKSSTLHSSALEEV